MCILCWKVSRVGSVYGGRWLCACMNVVRKCIGINAYT
uniref:Uncharacterized protein n=1 Tax=Arundo donax TaxID=35708 RepID=A0A0A8YPN9_ARUDO